MRLRQLTKSLVLVAFLFVFSVSCSRIKPDAKKAAKYTEKSLIKTYQLKLIDAERYFFKSQEILQKYKSHKRSEKFYELYQQYRDEGKYPVVIAEDEE